MHIPIKPIEFGDEDGTTVIGTTRMGKTFGAIYSLKKQSKGVLFINTKRDKMPAGWTKATADTDLEDITDELIGGGKVAYWPSKEYRHQELPGLIAWLFKVAEEAGEKLDIYVAVDECHLYTKKALAACKELATTGCGLGLKPVWISQRPALIDNTLITQSTSLVCYDLSPAEVRWLKEYRYPHEEIYAKLHEVRPDNWPESKSYAYVAFDGAQLKGAYRVS